MTGTYRTLLVGAAAVLALGGCSESGGDDGGGTQIVPGGNPQGMNMGGVTGDGQPGPGGNTTVPGATGDTPAAPGAPGGDMGGDTPGGNDGMQGGDGMAGAMGDDGAGGAMADPPAMNDFMHCVSGIENWGTEIQAGPCGSSETRYGVMIEYGPYGARMEYNVGQGHEVTVASGDSDGGLQCSLFVATFAADPDGSAELQMTMDLDFALHTVYYPGVMPEGETFPLIVWGNGTCAMPEGYGALLRYVASHGYIVVAPNSRWVGSNSAMIKGLDFMFAANDDPSSKYYQKIDTTKVGAMGHSQGGMATASASSDPRVNAVILFNGGTTASKPFLAISGDRDLFTTAASQLANPVNAAPRGAAFLFYHMVPTTLPSGEPTGPSAGHLTLMMEPERVVEATVGWWDMVLKDDATARDLYIGDNCGLCGRDAEFEYGHNGML